MGTGRRQPIGQGWARRWVGIVLLVGLAVAVPPVLAQLGDPEAVAEYRYALGLIERRLYPEAANVLARVNRGRPSFPEADLALFWEGECRFRMGEYAAAVAVLNTLIERFPDRPIIDRAHYTIGWCHTRDGNPKSAIEAFALVGRADPRLRADALARRGALLVQTGMAPAAVIANYQELLAIPGIDDRQRFDAQVQLGIHHLNLGVATAAVDAFNLALPLAPPESRPSTLVYLGEARFRAGEFEKAAHCYDEAVALATDTPLADQARYSLAWCHIRMRKPERALPQLERLVTRATGATRTAAVKTLLELNLNLHRYAEVIAWAEKAGADLPPAEALEVAWVKALALSRTGEFERALTAFADLRKRFPKSERATEAVYQTALVQISLGRFRDAIATLEPLKRASTPAELREKALYRIGECHFNLGDGKNARAVLLGLLKEYPKGKARHDALYQLGEIENLEGRTDDALAAFDAVADAGGELAGQARFRAAEVRMKAGRTREAIAGFEQYLADHPDGDLRDDARFKLGMCQLEAGNQPAAIAEFSQLREAKGFFRHEARLQVAQIAMSIGNFPLAIQEYKVFLLEADKHPLRGQVRRNVGICQFRLKDYESAEKTLREILKDLPASDAAVPESRLWLGRTLIGRGQTDDGILEILKVPVLYPKSGLVAEAYAEAARAYAAAGKADRAARLYKDLLKSTMSGPFAEEARAFLAKNG